MIVSAWRLIKLVGVLTHLQFMQLTCFLEGPMKTIVTVSLLLLIAVTAQADPTTIYDIQTIGPEGGLPYQNLVTPHGVVVVAVRYNGIFVSEAPYTAYHGIWVYTGTDHGFVEGDVVNICGEYKEYYDLSEIDIPAAETYGYILKTGTQEVPAPTLITAAELLADQEPWESCMITITDGMEIIDTSLGNGEWLTLCVDASEIRFDDYWVDFSSVEEETCYQNATGIYYYSYGNFKLEAFADGVDPVNCIVSTEIVSLGGIKALYR